MATDRIRTFAALEYGDPRGYLIELAKLERQIAASNLDVKVRTLRTNQLKEHRERRQDALLCCFMAERMKTEILFSPVEAQDFDFVGRWEGEGSVHYVPTQIKEVVPANLNPKASVSSVVASLAKYTDSKDLTVAIHLNQNGSFDPSELSLSQLSIRALWVIWATAPGGRQWALCGDLLTTSECTTHSYPAA